jgi:hypothetical protein
MLRTRELLQKHVHHDIVTIVVSYVQSAKRDWISIAEAGEYETCLEIPMLNMGLNGTACHEPIRLMIAARANDWNCALRGGIAESIEYKQIPTPDIYLNRKVLSELMIAPQPMIGNGNIRGVCCASHELVIARNDQNGDQNGALFGACRGGHKEIVELVIVRGANDWNNALYSACFGGHKEIVELIIARGANNWNNGLFGACVGGHKQIAELVIARGANDLNWALHNACRSGHKELVELMIALGASECLACRKSMVDHHTSIVSCQ